jgi:S-DNA-T family DNA segregation ATPase FtsK/SpoIIIE
MSVKKKKKTVQNKKRISVKKRKDNPTTNIIILLVFGFFLLISLFEVGNLGNWIHQLFANLFGGPMFSKIIQIGLYFGVLISLFKLKTNKRKLVALILTLIAINLAMTIIFINTSGKDLANIRGDLTTSINKNEFSGGGIIGLGLYQIISPLIGNVGVIILTIFLAIVAFFLYRNFSQEDQKAIADKVKKNREQFKAKRIQRKEEKLQSNVELYDNPTDSKVPVTNETNILDFAEPIQKKSDDESGFYTINGLENPTGSDLSNVNQDLVFEHTDNYFSASDKDKNKKDDIKVKSFEPNNISNKDYQIPTVNLLDKIDIKIDKGMIKRHVESQKILVEQTLQNFGILGKVVNINIGPVVTQYEITLSIGVKVSSLVNIQNDLALALAAKDIRIQAPIPGKNVVGIEVPNLSQQLVPFEKLAKKLLKTSNQINVPVGLDINNEIINIDITKMPHLLVAGSTGSGKSVFINLIITSILMQASPDQIKLIMIDPKKVELAMYEDIPHLLMPVVTEAPFAAKTLNYVVKLMEERYEVFKQARVRNIESYNQQNNPKIPYLVVIIDELADLMMVAKKEVEGAIIRITQMARAAGIHLVVATQRPSTDVITGIIKANIPSRIAFAVSSQIDSRTILDSGGAEKLIGRGDMLYQPLSANFAQRIQCGFISDDEVNRIVEFITNQQTADFSNIADIMQNDSNNNGSLANNDKSDELFEDVKKFVISSQKASASLVQRRFNIGFNRAANIIDELEIQGIVGSQNGSKPRDVLVSKNEGSE